MSVLDQLIDGKMPSSVDIACVLVELRQSRSIFVPSDMASQVTAAAGAQVCLE